MKKNIVVVSSILLLTLIGFFATRKKLEIVNPKVGPLVQSVYAISTVKSESNFTLRMGVLSNVEKYYVHEGDEIKTGDKLLTVEGGTTFKSPQNGIVVEMPYGIKETIAPQSPIIKIVDLKNLYLEASIEQMAALKINKGMKVLISFDDYRNEVFHGQIRSVLPREQDFVIQVKAENLPKNILPGMSADLSIEIGKKEKAITISNKAISNGYIILKKNGKSEKTKVEIGISDVESSEIISPLLNENDEIVIPAKEKF